MRRGRLLIAALLSAAAVQVGMVKPALAGAIQNLPGCEDNILPANDDGSTGAVSIGFTLNFFGNPYSQLFINNNGNVTFDTPISTFTPFPLMTTDRVIIAPFFADVDTRGTGSGVVTYGQTTFGTLPALCVNWAGVGVGYYNEAVDKRNSFQLLLVDRSDSHVGDFDIIMNYDRIEWETGDASGGIGGLGGSSARVGFSNGDPTNSFELPGSAVNGAFLDTSSLGLIRGSQDNPGAGRYVFHVRNGTAPLGTQITGNISSPYGAPLAGAIVEACPSPMNGVDPCLSATTNAQGRYVISGFDPLALPSNFELKVYPPAGTDWLPFTLPGVVTVNPDSVITSQNLVVGAPSGIPVGTKLSPSSAGAGGVPTVYWNTPLSLSTHGCTGGTASYTVTKGATTVSSGAMPEAPPNSGAFATSIPPFYPVSGYATVAINLACPDGTSNSSSFDIYIDPSGLVHTTRGASLEGATVTLFRSDTPFGLFELVPDGSAIMGPSNRANPSASDVIGHFGWDVIAGYYRVRVEKPGCTSPTDPSKPFFETEVLEVPPEVTNLDLILNCDGLTPPDLSVPSAATAEATSAAGAAVTFAASAFDDVDGQVAVSCSPPSGSTFPIGLTTVVCTSTDAAGNTAAASFAVLVQDTAPPALSLPGSFSVDATSTAGAAVTYAASASDAVSGALTPTCSPASGSAFPFGVSTVTCSTADLSGNAASSTFQVNVAYGWSNVLSPINLDGSSSFKKWYDIPVAFALTGASAGVTDAAARLFLARVQNGVVGPELPALPSGHANCGNNFEFNEAEGLYTYELSTDSFSLGLYRLRIDLGDGELHTVLITLK